MMGAGKSSVGRALAELSGREFVDTDLLLQHRLGRPIRQIFHIYGEDAFRDHESSILKGLKPGPIVLATGGGIVIRPENWTELRRLGVTIYLATPPDVLVQRLEASKKKRPLLEAEDWPDRLEQLVARRRELYEQADIQVRIAEEDVKSAAATVHRAILEAGKA